MTDTPDPAQPGSPMPLGGYQVPYLPPVRPAPPPGDPLTGPPDESFGGWFQRAWGFVRRSWLPAGLISLGAVVLPSVLLAVPLGLLVHRLGGLSGDPSPAQLASLRRDVVVLALVTIGPVLLLMYLQSAALVANLRLMARDTVGAARDLPADLRYGLRRGAVLALWQLLEVPVVLIGFLCCLVPGYYLQLALSQVPPAVAFEPGRHALPRSFRLMHRDFWPSVGRMLITSMIAGTAASMVSVAAEVPLVVAAPFVDPALLVAVFTPFAVVLAAPTAVLQCAGTLATYTGLRAKEPDPPTGARLVASAE